MNKILLTFIVSILFSECNTKNNSDFKITTNSIKFNPSDTLKIQIKSTKSTKVLVSSIYIDDKLVKPPFTLLNYKLGKHVIKAEINASEDKIILEKEFTLYAKNPPELYSYKLINSYPHDKTSYTQGLEFSGDTLFESTGLRGQSKVRSLNFSNGKIINEKILNEIYFGEGLSILNNNVYQLTWQEDIGFIYDKNLTSVKGSFKYDKSNEGWGLCNDGQKFYKSDGSNKIWILEAENLNEVNYLEVMTNNKAINKINELEWVEGKIYANTYQFNKDVVLIINPISGAVEGVIDFSGLKKQVEQIETLNVLNGIAYNHNSKTLFVTGKNWSKLFEVIIYKANE